MKGGVGWGAKNASNFVGNRVGRAFDNAKQYQGRGGAVVRWAARTNFAQDTVGTAVNTMQNAKFGNTRTVEADRQMRNRTEESVRRREELDARNVPPLTPASNADQIAARQEARRVQRAQVGHMSNEEVLNLARTNKAMLLTPEFASLLSDAQVTAIENSGILSTDENINLNTQRNTGAFADIEATLGSTEASQENLTATMEELNRTMSTMSNERLTEMNQSQLINPNIASQLSDAQLTTLQQSGTRTPAQIQEIRNARNAGLTRIVHNGSLASSTSLTTAERDTFNDRQRRRLFRNAQDAGRLPVDALADEAARPYLTPQIITEFLNNNPSQPDIERVRQNVMEYITDPSITDNMTQSWTIWSNTTVQGRRFGLHS
ncbi:MAG TPA: hypothetical protein PKD95_00265 [Candidatus Paceibacterota bacterium]|nr:hypothetical protein [Candidatus Paceibacterota bacterium]